eukprot:CAMPEP_0113500292 /NCGR_PEP_ID=MMETSP0014_2-20120614/32233_1 /TAXON_ID=2857 /ORGANISM="Nitzschia sp." /LENGTH=561 /DNA_ID=CAMNT_0000394583 /DNA_START=26 /DNA_END=1711 /DNA_ORIENTATION=+ /assembly_acc=CAM_ASM_000159
MRISASSLLFFAGYASSSVARADHAHEHQHLKPYTHAEYHRVEAKCQKDVEKFCDVDQGGFDLLRQFYAPDPFMSFVLAPTTQFFTLSDVSGSSTDSDNHVVDIPPEIHDISLFMDKMVQSVMSMHEAPRISTVIWSTENSNEDFQQQQEQHREHANLLVDSAVNKIVTTQETPVEEIPKLATDLQSYGHKMLEVMDPAAHDLHRHIGRRLTEVDPTTIQHHVRLPFGCPKNRCLRAAIAAGRVSPDCAEAVSSLEKMYVIEQEAEREEAIFVGLLWVYIAMIGLLMYMVARRFRADRSRRRLAQRVLTAVYASKDIKEKIENELGESIGDHAPVPVKFLASSSAAMKRRLRCLRRVHAIFLVAMATLVFVAPFWVLPACILMTFVRVVQLCVIGSGAKSAQDDCTCCCCAATPSLAKAGMLSKNSNAATAAKVPGRVPKRARAAVEVAVGVGVMARTAAAVRANCAFCRRRRSLAIAHAVAAPLLPVSPRLACSARNSSVATAAKVPESVQRLVVPVVEAVEAVLATAKTAPAADDSKKDQKPVLKARCAVYEGVPIQVV